MSPGAAVIFGMGLVFLTVAATVCVCNAVAKGIEGFDIGEALALLIIASFLFAGVYFGVNAYAAAWGYA